MHIYLASGNQKNRPFGYLYSPLAWVVGDFWEILENNGGWGFTCGCGFTFLRFYLREKGVFLEKKVCVWRKRCIFVG